MTLLFTADWHCQHEKILALSDRDFLSLEEMEQHLISNLLSMWSPGDILYILGDFALRDPAEILDRMKKVRIHFLFGNHEHRKQRKIIAAHPRVDWTGTMRSISLSSSQSAVVCHYKMYHWSRSHYGAYQLHGHSHGMSPERKQQLDVGIDNAFTLLGEYRPFTEDEVVEQIERINASSQTEGVEKTW